MESKYETVSGIENLKDEYRKAKLQVGDLRGLGKNRFALSEKLGISPLQTFFYAAHDSDKPIEIEVEIADNEYDLGSYEYRLFDIVKEAKSRIEQCFVRIHARTYTSRFKNDSNASVVKEFYYIN